MDKLIFTEKELAKHLDLPTEVLKKWRSRGNGIPFNKEGGVIVYKKNDILEFLITHMHWGIPNKASINSHPMREKIQGVLIDKISKGEFTPKEEYRIICEMKTNSDWLLRYIEHIKKIIPGKANIQEEAKRTPDQVKGQLK
jgi:hypothetical protein